jgi:hypothetical protein
MIKRNFHIGEHGHPVFHLDETYYMLMELGSCDKSYVDVIVQELDRILKNEIPSYYFGYERYTCICSGENCIVKDLFENRDAITIPTTDIYLLMKEWKAYYEEWERSQG